MSVVPTWLAATPGTMANPGQINQFLAAHTSTWLYSGVQLVSQQAIGSAVYLTTASQYLGQAFTTGVSQTVVGQVALQISTVGGSPTTNTIAPLTLTLYADAFGVPDPTTPIASSTLPETSVYSSPFWVTFPLAATVTSATQYWLVVSPAGTGSNYYVWQKSNQPSGAALSTDNVTWTEQTFGLMYQIYDQTAGGRVTYMYDDAGARWIQLAYDTSNRISTITEFTVGQAGTTFLSTRSLAYGAANTLIGVS